MVDALVTPADDTAPAGGTGGTDDAAEPIVALTVDDRLLHIAPAAEVLTHLQQEAGPNVALDPSTWNFFRKDGIPLVLQTDSTTGGATLVEDTTKPPPEDLDRQLVLDRIDLFLARVQVVLDRELKKGISSTHTRVPRLTGDLPDVVTGLAAVMTVPQSTSQPHIRDFVHNLGHL